MTNQTDLEFYLQIEDFILNATIDGCESDTPREDEIRLLLLTLVHNHKVREIE